MAIGKTGKEYTKDAAGTLTIKRPDGSTGVVKVTDSNYANTVKAMHMDGAKDIGVTQAVKPVVPQVVGDAIAEVSAPSYTPYTSAPYTDPYSGIQNDYLQKLINRPKFSYDQNTDPAYAAYAKQYGFLGDQAMEDTLGEVASMTGGMPSSYAVTAAQQAKNQYNSRLGDLIPQLQDAAYQKYQGEMSNDMGIAGLIGNMSDSNFNRYDATENRNMQNFQNNFSNQNMVQQQDLQQNNWQSTFDYNKGRDVVADNQWNKTFTYQQLQDKIANGQWTKEFTEKQRTNLVDEMIAKGQLAVSQRNSAISGGHLSLAQSKANEANVPATVDPNSPAMIESILSIAFEKDSKTPENWIRGTSDLTAYQKELAIAELNKMRSKTKDEGVKNGLFN